MMCSSYSKSNLLTSGESALIMFFPLLFLHDYADIWFPLKRNDQFKKSCDLIDYHYWLKWRNRDRNTICFWLWRWEDGKFMPFMGMKTTSFFLFCFCFLSDLLWTRTKTQAQWTLKRVFSNGFKRLSKFVSNTIRPPLSSFMLMFLLQSSYETKFDLFLESSTLSFFFFFF